MDIQILNQQKHLKISAPFIRAVLKQCLLSMNAKDKEVSVVLVDDEQIHKLNLEYRHKDSPTDVLSFCQQEEDMPSVAAHLLGDIVISIPTAARQAQERGHSLEQELKILLIHGLLHLLGYDHIQDDEAEVMEAKESELLNQVQCS